MELQIIPCIACIHCRGKCCWREIIVAGRAIVCSPSFGFISRQQDRVEICVRSRMYVGLCMRTCACTAFVNQLLDDRFPRTMWVLRVDCTLPCWSLRIGEVGMHRCGSKLQNNILLNCPLLPTMQQHCGQRLWTPTKTPGSLLLRFQDRAHFGNAKAHIHKDFTCSL